MFLINLEHRLRGTESHAKPAEETGANTS
jgi:hypothetical protein